MIYDIEIAKQVAKSLLQINAIILQPNNPFKWAAGWNSPIYCDNRKILGHPKIRNFIKDEFIKMINQLDTKPTCIAGVATGGIAIGALIAESLNLPFCYVRSSAKAHGLNNKIEGDLNTDQSVFVIEDLISSGKSSLDAVSALRNFGVNHFGFF
jgi:orotate phosphoribosyltransferase